MNKSTVKLDMTASQFQEIVTDMVTIDGRPLSIIHDSWFTKVFTPIAKQLKITTNDASVRSLLDDKYQYLKNIIINDVKKKMIAVKIDSATIFDRNILGINIQYYCNEKIVVKTIAMKELLHSCTSTYINSMLNESLNEFEINVDQIFCVTTDNGANMVAAVKKISEQCNEYESDESVDDVDNEETNEDIEIEESENIDLLYSFLNFEFGSSILRSVRCAAHTLQLAVKDFLKMQNVNSFIIEAKSIVKELRLPRNIKYLKRIGSKQAIKDCPTRWSSTRNMLSRLLELKEHCSDMTNNESLFEELHLITEALEPVHSLNIKLQREILLPGDFYSDWVKCKLKLGSLKHSYATLLMSTMNDRENMILSNDALLAAVYLDPRYKSLITGSKVNEANQYIANFFQRFLKLKCIEVSFLIFFLKHFKTFAVINMIFFKIDNLENSEEQDVDDFEKILISNDKKFKSNEKNVYDILKLLKDYQNESRIDRNEDILKYWEKKKTDLPEFSEVALLLQSLPVTQVSVERAFSSLHYIYNNLRTSLKPDLLHKILFIRLNNKK